GNSHFSEVQAFFLILIRCTVPNCLVGVIACFITFGVLGYLLYLFSNKAVGNRASDEDQEEGLDFAEMGIAAYTEEEDSTT
ncbi:MAG: hypothetical protein AAFY98_11590, partial [Verrucomicrobiota bacterium]